MCRTFRLSLIYFYQIATFQKFLCSICSKSLEGYRITGTTHIKFCCRQYFGHPSTFPSYLTRHFSVELYISETEPSIGGVKGGSKIAICSVGLGLVPLSHLCPFFVHFLSFQSAFSKYIPPPPLPLCPE